MPNSLLAFINLIAILLVASCLAQGIAQDHWQRRGAGSVVTLIILWGQIWLLPQAINFFAFHSTRLLYPLWFGNWLSSAVSVIFFCLLFRGRSRDLVAAARLDGMGAFGIFRHVVWPTAGPALALLAIILFMATWSEFARPFMPPGSSTPSSSGLGQWPMPVDPQAIAMIVGSSIIATFPVIGLFFFARRSFLRAIPSPPN